MSSLYFKVCGTDATTAICSVHRPVGTGGGGLDTSLRDFGRSVIPIPTRGGRLQLNRYDTASYFFY